MKNINLSLLDNFEFIGKWWLSEFPEDVVAGRISYSAHDSILLELIGRFDQIDSDNPIDPTIMLGISTEGHLFTLIDCMLVGSRRGYPGFETQHFESRYLMVGHHFNTKSDLQFSSFAVSYEHLEEWYGERLYKTDLLNTEGFFSGYNVKFERPKPVDIPLPSRKGVLNISFAFNNAEERNRSFTIKNQAFLVVRPFASQELDWFNRFFFDIERFLIFTFTSVTFPRRIEVYIDIGGENRKRIDIFRIYEKRKSKDIYRWEMLLAYPQLATDFPAILNRWLINIEEARPAYDLFFSYLYKPDNYLEFKFLALAQALESYHRSIKGKNYSRRKKVSLRERLEDLFSDLETSLQDLVSPDYATLISEIIATRNYFTHYDEKGKKKSLSYQEMIVACKRMQVFLTILFLRQLEIDSQIIIERVSKNKRLRL
ncbi:HEPN domain-containing protein [Candidatus Leptofilum sp.]|uniref:ApeA N-terminal domain 1-containing protein n=1 Tax=Candidatus Leptofilum sp. TaxID=3241576 RepID=UPI003B59C0F3